MEGFEDLYKDAIVDVIELKESPSFETIKSYFSNLDEMERNFSFNGRKIVAKRKFTYKGMRSIGKMFEIKTNYLHVWMQVDNVGNMKHYKENKKGNFELV